jgi:non-homologous end joining protein Ku
MRGDNHELALTTTVDEITGETKPLFSFPIQICKAINDPSKDALDSAGPSGAPAKQQYVDTGTGEVVEGGRTGLAKGVRVGDEFKMIDPEAVKAIDEATKVTTMIALGQIKVEDFRAKYGDRIRDRYFLQVPAKGGSATAYKLTYEALLKSGKAIVTKRTPRTRQQMGVIYADPMNGCLMMVEVLVAALVREPDEQIKAFETATVQAKMLTQAKQIIGKLPDGAEVLDTEEDDAVPLRKALVEQAIAGEGIEAPVPVATTNQAEDLSALLEASLA